MFSNKKTKPLYKQFLKLRENSQNRKKLLTFKKIKWKNFIRAYAYKLKFKQIPKDQFRYLVSEFPHKETSYKKRFRNNFHNLKNLKLHYGNIAKKKFKQILKKTINKKISNSNLLLKVLEKRLDTVLYKSNFSTSMKESQQYIIHGMVLVNNKIIRSKSYNLQTGDIITINPNYQKLIKNNINQILKESVRTKKNILKIIPRKQDKEKLLQSKTPKELNISYEKIQINNNGRKNSFLLYEALFAAKFCINYKKSKKFIFKGIIKVNNKTIKNPFYLLQLNDVITIKPKYHKIIKNNIDLYLKKVIQRKLNEYEMWPIPSKHLTINYRTLQIIFGDIVNNNLSTHFIFHTNLEKIVVNYKKY
jgi:ribosomal protein S4